MNFKKLKVLLFALFLSVPFITSAQAVAPTTDPALNYCNWTYDQLLGYRWVCVSLAVPQNSCLFSTCPAGTTCVDGSPRLCCVGMPSNPAGVPSNPICLPAPQPSATAVPPNVKKVYTFFGAVTDTGSMEMLYLFVTKFLEAMYGFSVSLAILMIIMSGFQYVTAGGDEKAIKAAKERLQYALIGFIIILMSTLIYAYIFKLFY